MRKKFLALVLVVAGGTLISFSPMIAGGRANSRLTGQFVGTASWYGKKHQGRKMANGQKFDPRKLTAASWYYPLGTKIRVVNLTNGASVVVTVTDRGPNLRLHRLIDLSEAAAANLDYVHHGLTRVFVYPMAPAETQPAEFSSTFNVPETVWQSVLAANTQM